MILLIIYLMVGIIMCGYSSVIFEDKTFTVKACSYLIIMITWPIFILVAFGKALYNATKKDD